MSTLIGDMHEVVPLLSVLYVGWKALSISALNVNSSHTYLVWVIKSYHECVSSKSTFLESLCVITRYQYHTIKLFYSMWFMWCMRSALSGLCLQAFLLVSPFHQPNVSVSLPVLRGT